MSYLDECQTLDELAFGVWQINEELFENEKQATIETYDGIIGQFESGIDHDGHKEVIVLDRSRQLNLRRENKLEYDEFGKAFVSIRMFLIDSITQKIIRD